MAGAYTEGGPPDPDSQVDDIAARLSGIAYSGVSSGRFAYNPDQLRKIIKGWQDLADGYADDIEDAERVKQVQAPGLDFASKAFAQAAFESGDALQQSLSKERDLCRQQASKYEAALNAYLGLEQDTVDDMNKQKPGTVL